MTYSQNAVDLIKSFEGLYLHGYKGAADKDGLITIGYGSITYEDGSKIRYNDVITKDRAEQLLKWEMDKKAKQLDTILNLKNVKLSQNKFDAILSFCYNLGINAFQTSTLFKKMQSNVNDPNIYQYDKTNPVDSCQFLRWVRSNGKVWDGLIRRRKAEADMYKKLV